jgi:hypothetical protein
MVDARIVGWAAIRTRAGVRRESGLHAAPLGKLFSYSFYVARFATCVWLRKQLKVLLRVLLHWLTSLDPVC